MFQLLYRHFDVHHGCFYEIMVILNKLLKSQKLYGNSFISDLNRNLFI